MNLDGVDLIQYSKQIYVIMDRFNCDECCKRYLVPETALCGHTLCHNCWRGGKSCPVCKAAVDKRTNKQNMMMQQACEHVQTMSTSYEKLFNTKLDDFRVDSMGESENDPGKNIMEWLTSSQNHFSAPAQSSEQSSQEILQNPNPIKVPPSNIQVHTPTKKAISPEKVVRVSIPQEGWDAIETMPDMEVVEKNKDNIIGPMDIEPFYVDDDKEYTAKNLRRSSRKRDLKGIDNSLMEKENLKDLSPGINKKITNAKQNWSNVKKMRKEFSKLNKINKSKLNVSIEMCKKTQSTAKTYNVLQNVNTPQVYEIDENTPKLTLDVLPEVEMIKKMPSDHKSNEQSSETQIDLQKSNLDSNHMPVDDQASKNLSQSLLNNDPHPHILNRVNETRLQISGPDNEKPVKLPFYKKSALCTTNSTRSDKLVETKQSKTANLNIESNCNTHEDIEITIKVGDTIANIIIKKKNDIQLKVTTDKEIQTSQCPLDEASVSPQKMDTKNVSLNIESNNEVNKENRQISQENKSIKQGSSLKSASAKKNTASADTGTGQFEITESVEKELSNIMEYATVENQHKAKSTQSENTRKTSSKAQSNIEKSQRVTTPITQLEKIHEKSGKPLGSQNMNTPDLLDQEVLDYINDADIFESDTVKQTNIQLLKHTRNTTPSEILISTAHNRNKTQKTEKRYRADENDDLPTSKKHKHDDNINKSHRLKRNMQPESEPMNYDSIMGQVFAKIDADMEELKSQNASNQKHSNKDNVSSTYTESKAHSTQKIHSQKEKESEECKISNKSTSHDKYPKDSENIFSVCVEKDTDTEASAPKNDQVQDFDPLGIMDDFVTPDPGTKRRLENAAMTDSQVIEINNDDSESVVEDTPQKDTSFGKPKPKSITKQHSSQRINVSASRVQDEKCSESINTVINIADDIRMCNDVTIIDTARITNIDKARITNLETPLNITKFVQQIQHNSTPVARKSLNFEKGNLDELEATLCPSEDEKTTQEREFMRKAFEKTPTTQAVKPVKGKKLCLTGSCLSSNEIAKVRVLCAVHKWTYVDKYTKDLTHLVVGVDEENKSQRSLKYMCALAASKWIVTIEWVEKCLETKTIVGEEKYEALDSSGEPGPRRSRVAARKLFQGITFYCMEPFNVLDVDTLKEMLESSSGRVVNDPKEVTVTDQNPGPAILLAEPENTQEDRFIYLAMDLSIVPVNFEWVLNCLGSYTISSVHELLLCPSSVLPKAIERWPVQLIERDDDSIIVA